MPDSLEVQLARVDEQLKAFRQEVEGVRYIAQGMHDNAKKLAVHEEKFQDVRADIAAVETRLQTAVERFEKACNDLGNLLRTQAKAVTKVENAQDQQTQALSRREKWLLLLATAFAGGAVTLLVNYLSTHHL